MRDVRPRFRIVSIIPGIEERAPERTETSSGFVGSPKRLSASCSSCASADSTSARMPSSDRAAREVGADRRLDREARRHRDAERGHLREARALAAERFLAEAGAFGHAVSEREDAFHFRSTTISEKSARRREFLLNRCEEGQPILRRSSSGQLTSTSTKKRSRDGAIEAIVSIASR